MNSSILIITMTLVLAFYLGIRAKKGREMKLDQWAVGGRNFGSLIMFVLMAGEMFSTFVFLGASGAAYRMGGPTIYIFCALTYIVPFWILPPIWRYAKKHNVLTQSDFFTKKYNSKPLGLLVAVIGVLSMIPYIVLQLKGFQIIVSEASYGFIPPTVAVWIGMLCVTVFVYVSGIHGSAWTAVLKDILILVVIVFLGIYLPIHYFGGIQPMFETLEATKPGFLLLPDKGFSISWYISLCLTIALGQYMWPHCFGASLSSQNESALRKNSAILPLYQIILVFILFIGFTAVLQIPNLQGGDTDLALFKIAKDAFPPWIVGVVGAAGMLAALVPCSMLILTAATILSKNIYKAVKPDTSNEQLAKLTRIFVPIVSLVSLIFTFYGGNTMIALLTMAYSFVLQLFPPLVFSLLKRNPVSKAGASAGMILGVVLVAYFTLAEATMATLLPKAPYFIQDLDIGIVAITFNLIVMLAVSAFTRKDQQMIQEEEPVKRIITS
ncbi:SSS family solute:Na+ symporter [Peribacillus frigoritolerans]|uniref:sodium:solute symporter family protein n=1 Tax=Peribacillus frigoritolerans TaxID=450367 RepID=UPI0020A0C2FB|nr:sodium:solute symporter [Peribacillus frigoritolerans]MCP1491450.1 SSS family solute:Na+ symporter [Peribacillus frigoritolerans]